MLLHICDRSRSTTCPIPIKIVSLFLKLTELTQKENCERVWHFHQTVLLFTYVHMCDGVVQNLFPIIDCINRIRQIGQWSPLIYNVYTDGLNYSLGRENEVCYGAHCSVN